MAVSLTRAITPLISHTRLLVYEDVASLTGTSHPIRTHSSADTDMGVMHLYGVWRNLGHA